MKAVPGLVCAADAFIMTDETGVRPDYCWKPGRRVWPRGPWNPRPCSSLGCNALALNALLVSVTVGEAVTMHCKSMSSVWNFREPDVLFEELFPSVHTLDLPEKTSETQHRTCVLAEVAADAIEATEHLTKQCVTRHTCMQNPICAQ